MDLACKTGIDIVRRGKATDDQTIRHELEGNLCRCTGYQNIVDAISDCARGCASAQGLDAFKARVGV